ncbi:MAG: Flp pilus assembly complex ATPase component TadA [Alphaproteobacteria bacterium]|nr:Flp pilus assembly complex ATPase component TadA [Alphaproteobacteria bacterium]
MEVIDLTNNQKGDGGSNLPARLDGVYPGRSSDLNSSGRIVPKNADLSEAGSRDSRDDSSAARGIDPRGRMGERMVASGMITLEQLNVALQEKKISGRLLGQVLIDLGFIQEFQLVEFLADSSGHHVFDPKSTVFDGDALALIEKADAKKLRILPVSYREDTAVFAVIDPYDIVALDSIKRIVPKTTTVKYLIATPSVLSDAIDAAYGYSSVIEDILKELDSGKTNPEDVIKVSEDQAYSHPIVRLVNALLIEAVKTGVSDLHFEPEENFVRLRYRLDGVLFTAQILHKKIWNGVSQRIKIMSKMNIADKLAPQDGRFNLNIGDREADFRVSSLPTVHGENIVLRVLDKSASIKPLEKLGFSPENLARIRRAQARPEGIIIVTGPTGSGKSTSLYSMINEINKVEVNIQTLEDPVEYSLPMIRQTYVREGILEFADGIKALLRQDPDIIFIGEIRDGTTGEMALKAAMTGHQVYTTLHTNDSFGAIPRLVDLGLKPGMIAGAVIAVFAQRLVRKLCPECKQEISPDPDQCKILGIQSDDPRHIYRAAQGGCNACSGQGYKGRVAIAEILLMDEDLDEVIARGGTKVELKRTAQQKGFKSMRDDGILKVLDGITSLEEVAAAVHIYKD